MHAHRRGVVKKEIYKSSPVTTHRYAEQNALLNTQTLSTTSKMTVKSDSNAHLLLSSTPALWNEVTHLQLPRHGFQIQLETPQLKHNLEPFHIPVLLCVYTFHTDKSLLFLLLGFCLTCVFMSAAFSTSEVMISGPAPPRQSCRVISAIKPDDRAAERCTVSLRDTKCCGNIIIFGICHGLSK